MTRNEIMLVKRSWSLLRNIDSAVLGEVFYGKLFADKPALRRLFPNEMGMQHQKLMDMMNFFVARLDENNKMDQEIAAMGKRHFDYGVKPGHFEIVGAAFLWTLEKGLGADFTAEVKEAWITCYRELSQYMQLTAP